MSRSMNDEARSVAIIGLTGRFPGRSGPDQLWELLCDGMDATSETPPDRYTTRGQGPEPGMVASRHGGYLDEMAEFDREFFEMSATEAAELDPQQRLLMMSLWEAFEDAGQVPDELAGSRAGVFLGNAQSDYLDLQRQQGLEGISPSLMNNYRALLAGRLSHAFDLRGPSVMVDSACSSSLVAVHLAVQSLRAGETPLAIAAGVNLKLVPDESVLMTRAGTLARDGRSKFGDATADGYSPSDGAGVVVLKPLEQAVADGDRIRAVIQGSAVGNDGHSNESLLAPSVAGQTEVLRWAYDDADVSPAEVDFVEAHGAASAAEDAVELTALGEVLGESRPADRPFLVGSVKTNIGHSQGAAGITGLIKSVLCLEHGQVPPSLHFNTPNPRIAWDQMPLEVATKMHDLPDRGRPTIAGVTSQGMSCLYAHLVVRQGQTAGHRQSRQDGPDDETYVLALSARTSEALDALVDAYIDYLGPGGQGSAFALRDICHSAATRRQHHVQRLAVTGTSHEAMIAALRGSRRAGDEASPAEAGPRATATWIAERYRHGQAVPWGELFGPDCSFVPLPGYPWQLRRYWWGERTEDDQVDDPADAVLRQHARTGYSEDSTLSDIGIDSLAMLRIMVEVGRDHGFDVDAGHLAELRTVSAFRQWFATLEAAA